MGAVNANVEFVMFTHKNYTIHIYIQKATYCVHTNDSKITLTVMNKN